MTINGRSSGPQPHRIALCEFGKACTCECSTCVKGGLFATFKPCPRRKEKR